MSEGVTMGGGFVPIRPGGAVNVKIGTSPGLVSVGNGVDEAAREGSGVFVLGCGSREVLVGEGAGAEVELAPATVVSGKDVGIGGAAVLGRGCRR